MLLPARKPDVSCHLDVIPVPKGRPRFSKFGKPYTDQKTRAYEQKVAALLSEEGVESAVGPVVVEVTFTFARPKKPRHWLYPIIRGGGNPGGADCDNYLKAILDSANGILYVDDSLVVELVGRKIYGESPSVDINLWELADVRA